METKPVALSVISNLFKLEISEFELLEEVDNGGKKLLRVRVLVDGVEKARGEDFSKKRAEQIAAEKVCIALQLE